MTVPSQPSPTKGRGGFCYILSSSQERVPNGRERRKYLAQDQPTLICLHREGHPHRLQTREVVLNHICPLNNDERLRPFNPVGGSQGWHLVVGFDSVAVHVHERVVGGVVVYAVHLLQDVGRRVTCCVTPNSFARAWVNVVFPAPSESQLKPPASVSSRGCSWQ